MNPNELIICTPVDGSPSSAVVSHRWHVAVRQLERAGAQIQPAEVCFADDLSRGRSACVHYAMKQPAWKWLLFWDDDTVPEDTMIVPRMLELAEKDGHDIIAAPYPRKRIPASFPYKPLTQRQAVVNECVEVEFIAIGFCLIRRTCLETMIDAYSDEWFSDTRMGTHEKIVALFKQVHTAEDDRGVRELHGEDYSFMIRAREAGFKIQMYVGPGAPLLHVGGHAYSGTAAELGNVR